MRIGSCPRKRMAPRGFPRGVFCLNVRDDRRPLLHLHPRHHEPRPHHSARHRPTLRRPRRSDGRRNRRLAVPRTLRRTCPGVGSSMSRCRASPGSLPHPAAEGRPQDCSAHRPPMRRHSRNDPMRAATAIHLCSNRVPGCCCQDSIRNGRAGSRPLAPKSSAFRRFQRSPAKRRCCPQSSGGEWNRSPCRRWSGPRRSPAGWIRPWAPPGGRLRDGQRRPVR